MLLADGCFAAVHFKNNQFALYANALVRNLNLIGVQSKVHIF